jgi:hypothetical protein
MTGRPLDRNPEKAPSLKSCIVGRVSITQPQYGELRVCDAGEGQITSAFISYETGLKHCLSPRLFSQLTKVGQFRGWGYLEAHGPTVFRFVAEADSERPRGWLSISCGDQVVALPIGLARRLQVADGALVALRVRGRARRRLGGPRKAAFFVTHLAG